MLLTPSTIGAIQQDPLRRIFKQASLDLQFAERKSLVDATTGSNLVTFTRASSGTYVGSDGLIKTATTNLLTYSEEFEQWGKNNSTILTNTIAAPNGLETADKLQETAVTNYFAVNKNPTAQLSTTYTWSVFAKSAERTRIFVSFAALSNVRCDFNLSSETVVNPGTGLLNSSITPAGNGWYRCSITFATPASGSNLLYHIIGLSNGSDSYSGTAGYGAYIWGAQLEQSTTVGEYVKTTSTINSAPRFDHDPTTGESLGLLVEESRTNLLLQSGTLSNVAPWGVLGITPATNTVDTLAPNGENTATKFTEDASGTNQAAVFQSMSWTSGIAYTFTVFAKKGSENFIQLVFGAAAFGTSGFANFDLDAGVVGTKGSATSSSIQAIGNGWYRCIATATASSSATSNAGINIVDSASATRVANASLDSGTLYLWGAQLEAGSFPTSYIPTTSSTVTRAADVASISGSNFSSWYRQDEGTIYAEGSVPVGVSGARALAGISDGTNSERIMIGHNGTTAANGLVVDGNISQTSFPLTANSFPPGERKKVALAYKVNDMGFTTVPGTTVDQDSSGTLPTVDRLQIGNAPGRTEPNQPIRRLTYWPQRLPNEILQAVTQ